MSTFVHEFKDRLIAENTTEYRVQVWGEQHEGTWVGWLEFIAASGSQSCRTPRETSQATWEALTYWASGLEATYLEGAFHRAAPVN